MVVVACDLDARIGQPSASVAPHQLSLQITGKGISSYAQTMIYSYLLGIANTVGFTQRILPPNSKRTLSQCDHLTVSYGWCSCLKL